MTFTCTCIDICKCMGYCCIDFCGEPVCDHEKHECDCGILCDFCKSENEIVCICIDMCKCMGGCCINGCDSPVCDHEKHECVCEILCDFCKMEEGLLDLQSSMKRKTCDNDPYDADYDSDDADDGESENEYSERIDIPFAKKLRVN